MGNRHELTRGDTTKVGVVGRTGQKISRHTRETGDATNVRVGSGRVLYFGVIIHLTQPVKSTRNAYNSSQVETIAIAMSINSNGVGFVGREAVLAKASGDIGEVSCDRAIGRRDLNDATARSACC